MSKRIRSPNYPTMGLRTAIEKVRLVFDKEHTHKADPKVIAVAMGYTSLNGASMSAISALRKYGLLEDADGGLRVSKEAVTILVDPKDSKDRAVAIARAAFLPALFADLSKEYPDRLPSDENLKAFLIKRGFSPSTVDAPIRAYRETITLVSEVQKAYPAGEQKSPQPPPPEAEFGGAEIGDLVQWESGGVLQFDKPRRVRAIQEHDGADWVFVEGSETGIPMDEVLVQEQKPIGGAAVKPPTLPEATEVRALVGEREWLRGPLSKESSYRLVVSGDLGPKEIGKLIKLLEAQKAVLADDDEDGD